MLANAPLNSTKIITSCMWQVRGENVVLLGEIDEARDPPAALKLVSEEQIRQAQTAETEQEKIKKTMASRFDFLEFD